MPAINNATRSAAVIVGMLFRVRQKIQSLQCAYLGVETAFVARRLVLVHQTFTGHAIENRHGSRVGFRCGSFIARGNCTNHSLHMSTHHRAHTSVTGTSCFRLTSAFFGLGGVRQETLLKKVKIQPNSIVRGYHIVNRQTTLCLPLLTAFYRVLFSGSVIFNKRTRQSLSGPEGAIAHNPGNRTVTLQ